MTASIFSSSAAPSGALASGYPGTVPPAYLDMLRADGHDSPPAFFRAAAGIFRGVELRDKRVLEIGSGRGLMALYAALQGAAKVVSIEPELVGATSGVIAVQRQRVSTLGVRNVIVVPADFNAWNPGDARFDVVLSRASINHLYQSDRHALEDRATYSNYLRVVRKIHDTLAPGGVFIATDACRYALFTRLRKFGIRRPWRWQRSGVDWRHHQNPSTWARIFRDAGFSRTEVHYAVPYKLRHLGLVVNTAAANFFLSGTFIIQAFVRGEDRTRKVVP